MGSRHLSLLGVRAVERWRATHIPRAVTRSAIHTSARGGSDDARDERGRRGPRRRVGRGRARISRVGRRAPRDGRRSRGRAAGAGRRRRDHAVRSAGARDRRGRRRWRVRPREQHRGTDRAAGDPSRLRRQAHEHHRGAGGALCGRRWWADARRPQLDADDGAAHVGVEAGQAGPRHPHGGGTTARRARRRAHVHRPAEAVVRVAAPAVP